MFYKVADLFQKSAGLSDMAADLSDIAAGLSDEAACMCCKTVGLLFLANSSAETASEQISGILLFLFAISPSPVESVPEIKKQETVMFKVQVLFQFL